MTRALGATCGGSWELGAVCYGSDNRVSPPGSIPHLMSCIRALVGAVRCAPPIKTSIKFLPLLQSISGFTFAA